MNLNVDTLVSYVNLLYGLVGFSDKTVIIPETFEEQPIMNQGEICTKAIIDHGLVECVLVIIYIHLMIYNYMKAFWNFERRALLYLF